ncbi:hypothetical protein BDY24DRAFT_267539 [Mrakia frigida]|uniref:uncharacterized protein n=1 Tax=Mrakia frigida TaxID=29902 RepID=UPI003FCC20B9
MDYIKSAISGTGESNSNSSIGNQNEQQQQQQREQRTGAGGGGGGFMGKINNALGGGASGEAKEDYLDKTVDYIQEHVMGGGDQSNESAAEQAKDEMISDQIREAYKSATGKEFFVADKS